MFTENSVALETAGVLPEEDKGPTGPAARGRKTGSKQPRKRETLESEVEKAKKAQEEAL